MSTNLAFQINGLSHLGLACKDPEKARWFFTHVLELTHEGSELVAEQGVETIMFGASHSTVKKIPLSRLEILVPLEPGQGPVGKFLEKRGGGIHHLAFSVDNIEAVLAHLKTSGVKLIDQKPRKGAHQTKIIFVHPDSTGGLLIEFVQET